MTKDQTKNEVEMTKAEQAKQEFMKKVTKRKIDTMGENFPDVQVFLDAIDRCGSPFSILDVISNCKGSDSLDAEKITKLFSVWLPIQERFGRVSSIESIMDYPLFIKHC